MTYTNTFNFSTEQEVEGMTLDMWNKTALTYHHWATDPIVIHRKKRLSNESAKQVLGSVFRLLKERARATGLPSDMLAPLRVTEDIDGVSAWIRGQSTTRGYLSKQVCLCIVQSVVMI